MFETKKIVVIIPAGRRQYLEVLTPYLLKSSIVDEIHLWVNTGRQHDLEYIDYLTAVHKFKPVYVYDKITRPLPQPPFFRQATDKNTIYVKLDDDICYVEPNAIEQLVRFRLEHPNYFFVVGNIVNNGILAHIHQKIGAMHFDQRIPCEFHNCVWKSAKLANYIHKSFLEDLVKQDIDKYKFEIWTLDRYERIGINAIAWFGEDFARFEIPGDDEELWLCCYKAKQDARKVAICGTAIFAHYAFYQQRQPFCPEPLPIDDRILGAYRYIAQMGIDATVIDRILHAKLF